MHPALSGATLVGDCPFGTTSLLFDEEHFPLRENNRLKSVLPENLSGFAETTCERHRLIRQNMVGDMLCYACATWDDCYTFKYVYNGRDTTSFE